LSQLRLQHFLPRLELRHPILDRAHRCCTIQERLHEPIDGAVAPGKLGPGAFAHGVARGERVVWRVYSSQNTAMRSGSISPVLQPFEHGGLEFVPTHGALVGAGRFVAGVHAPDVQAVTGCDAAIANPAPHQAGEELPRTPPVSLPGSAAAGSVALERPLSCLDLLLQFLVDDPQVGLVADDPFGLGIEPGDPLPRLW
jgi:hypothetical protein